MRAGRRPLRELSQNERTHALQAMRDGRARVCIATDVAARGIDLPGLELVIHADLPTTLKPCCTVRPHVGRAGNKRAALLRRSSRRTAPAARPSACSVVPMSARTWALPPLPTKFRPATTNSLARSSLTEVITEDEAPMIASLIATHGAEQVPPPSCACSVASARHPKT